MSETPHQRVPCGNQSIFNIAYHLTLISARNFSSPGVSPIVVDDFTRDTDDFGAPGSS
jgi:hypothetical protein